MRTLVATVRRALPIWGLALVIVAVAELVARQVDDPGWVYWNRTMAEKMAVLHELHAAGRDPDLLFVGDSSTAFNIQPAVVDAILGTRSYNLGSAGNYASSFDLTFTRGILPDLPAKPRRMVVSFAGHGFDPRRPGQTSRVAASPIGQRALGRRVWGDHLALVRLHHALRLQRDPAPAPSIRTRQGYESFSDALNRRRRKPGLARAIPPPPDWVIPHRRLQPHAPANPMQPLKNLFQWARRHAIDVVLLAPPADDDRWIAQLSAVAAESQVPFINRQAADYPQHLSHLNEKHARRYSADIARAIDAL